MALTLPLHVAAALCRCSCSSGASTSGPDDSVIDIIMSRASLFDVIKWQQISKSFMSSARKRLDAYTMVDVKVYPGLRELRQMDGAEEGFDWHPSLALLLIDLEPNHLGIAIDSEMKSADVKALLHLLFILRQNVVQLYIDSPIIELLVSQISKDQINMLIEFLCRSRKIGQNAKPNKHSTIVPLHSTKMPEGPFFPNLKKLSIMSKANQLQHLSRLLGYAISVDLLYHIKQMDLLCLKILVGSTWSHPKSYRLFRHLTRFRQWTEASLLGERYFQQFGKTGKRRRSVSTALL